MEVKEKLVKKLNSGREENINIREHLVICMIKKKNKNYKKIRRKNNDILLWLFYIYYILLFYTQKLSFSFSIYFINNQI